VKNQSGIKIGPVRNKEARTKPSQFQRLGPITYAENFIEWPVSRRPNVKSLHSDTYGTPPTPARSGSREPLHRGGELSMIPTNSHRHRTDHAAYG